MRCLPNPSSNMQKGKNCRWEMSALCGRLEVYIRMAFVSRLLCLVWVAWACSDLRSLLTLTACQTQAWLIWHVQLQFVAQNSPNKSGRLRPCQHEISVLLFYNLHVLLAAPLWELTLLNCADSKSRFSASSVPPCSPKAKLLCFMCQIIWEHVKGNYFCLWFLYNYSK